ncbi:MAG TPA: EamA family transporter [Thermoanaerobaculia bacterium]|nr:EamA family transporter [Thermoanaerobaculia bacterium]
MKHERAVAYAAFATVCIVWGTTYLAIRIALETVPPMLLTATRFVIAGVVMLIIARLRGEKLPRDRRTLAHLTLVGFLMVGVGNLSVVWAEQWVPSGLAALLVATAPFWMAIIEAFRTGGERVDLRGGIGMLMGFLGVALLVTPGGSGGSWGLWFVLGALAIQFGGMCWQLGSAHGKYNLRHVPLLSSAALQMLTGGLITGIAGFAIGEAPRYALNARTFAAVAYLTIFGSVIAYSAYVFALAHMRTTHTSLYAYVNPVVAVFLGWLILDEPLTWLSIAAMIVILAGVAMVQIPRRTRVVSAESSAGFQPAVSPASSRR